MEYRLSDICLKVTDGSHFSPKDDVNSDIPMLSVKDMKEYDFDYEKCKHISLEDFQIMLRQDCVPKKDDILVAKDGSYLKEIFVNKTESKKAILSSIAIFRVNKDLVLPNYLCYLLKSPKVINYAKNNCVSGSALPRIILKAFKNIKLDIPSIEKQKKIVKILGKIDRKIELNNKTNYNLLEIIKANYEKYISECNNSEYEEYSAVELLDFISGVEPGSSNYSDTLQDGYIKFYRVGDMNSECKNYVNKELLKNKIATEDDILVSFDGTIGRITYGISGGFSTGIRNIKSKNNAIYKLSSAFILAYFTNKETINVLQENARGTTILHASSAIEHFKIKINKDTINKFMKLIDSLFKKIKINKLENENLTQIRDILLPKLMNGEIELENLKL